MRMVVLASLGLAGCQQTLPSAQDVVSAIVVPSAVSVQEVIEPWAPEPVDSEPRRGVHPDAVALIVRWEVSTPAYYNARLQGIICPPAASGPTWGIGYDGGHQTPTRIGEDWFDHADVIDLQSTSGIFGKARCQSTAQRLGHVRTPLDHATRVFERAMLPAYENQAARTFANGWDRLTWTAQGALVSLVLNRGSSMTGSTRSEMRMIRDECVPAADSVCIASQIRAMVRLWVGTEIEAGMRGRRYAEAELAERAGS